MCIEAGDIILVRGKHPIISPVIRWFTGSEYTHVGLAVRRDLIYEININRKMGVHKNEHEDFDVYRYKNGLTDEQKKEMKEYAKSKANSNSGYDWLKIIGFALEKIFKMPFVFDSINKEVCSEIVYKIYAAAGIKLISNKSPGHVTPSDLSKSDALYKVATITQ